MIKALKVKEAREATGMSQEALAEMLGLSSMQVQKYEAAKNRVSAGRLHMISLLTGKPIQWFFPHG